MKINYFIFSLLIYVLEYIYITFIYNMKFFSIFFMYFTLFTDTISNIPLTIAVIFSVFLEPDEHWQFPVMSCCSVNCDKLGSCVQ